MHSTVCSSTCSSNFSAKLSCSEVGLSQTCIEAGMSSGLGNRILLALSTGSSHRQLTVRTHTEHPSGLPSTSRSVDTPRMAHCYSGRSSWTRWHEKDGLANQPTWKEFPWMGHFPFQLYVPFILHTGHGLLRLCFWEFLPKPFFSKQRLSAFLLPIKG